MDEPADTLEHERKVVLAEARPPEQPLPPPTVSSAGVLHPLPADVAATVASRRSLGLAPFGRWYPRRRVWARVVVPSTVLALLCLGYCVYTAIAGRGLVAVGAGMLFLPFAALVAIGWRFALGDPYRLGRDPREATDAARQWSSRQDWSAPLDGTAARALLGLAADAIGRIAGSPSWLSDRRSDDRSRVDLVHELDTLDATLHGAAGEQTAGGAPSEDVVTRIAALRCYAAHLEASVPEGMTLAERIADRDRLTFFLDTASVGPPRH